MASKTEIANLAISHLGTAKEIANLETENSPEAQACRRFYDLARKTCLGALYWNFATKEAVLNLVGSNPTPYWAYSYRYPVDCLDVRRIITGQRFDTQASKVPFKIIKDAAGKLLYTDEALAEIEYTENVIDPTFFDEEFVLALSLKLAYMIAPRITGGDPFKMRRDLQGEYIFALSDAKKKNLNEEVSDIQPESPLILARS